MALPLHVARLAIAHSDDPQLVAEMVDLASYAADPVANFDPAVLPAPRVALPSAWVWAKQRGPLPLAQWAVDHCGDPGTLEAIYDTCVPMPPARLCGLARSRHLSAALRARIARDHGTDPAVQKALWESMDGDQLVDAIEHVPPLAPALLRELVLHRGACGLSEDQRVRVAQACRRQGHTHLSVAVARWTTDGPARRRIVVDLLEGYDWPDPAVLPREWPASRGGGRPPAPGDQPHGPRYPPAALAREILAAHLPVTDDEFTFLLARMARFPFASYLELATTRSQLALVLAHPNPDQVREVVAPRTLDLLTGPEDPLLALVVARSTTDDLGRFVAGSWVRRSAPSGAVLDPPQPLVPPAALLSVLVADTTRADSTSERPVLSESQLAQAAMTAVGHGQLPVEYRQRLVDTVPGLAAQVIDRADLAPIDSPLRAAAQWVWVRLAAATPRMDLALDQLATHPRAPLEVLCTAVANLDRLATPTAATVPTHPAARLAALLTGRRGEHR